MYVAIVVGCQYAHIVVCAHLLTACNMCKLCCRVCVYVLCMRMIFVECVYAIFSLPAHVLSYFAFSVSCVLLRLSAVVDVVVDELPHMPEDDPQTSLSPT